VSDATLIHAAVTDDETLTDLIAGRIYPLVLPAIADLELPAVTYGLASQPTDRTQADEQYRWPRWRFRVWSLRYADLEPVAAALAALFGYQAQTPFARSWIEYPQSQAEGHETDTNRYWRALDVVAFSPAGALSQ
jgi:hypothetical protein